MATQRIAVFPGSFDPFTIGHQSIVRRAAELFDKIIIAIGINDKKQSTHSEQERITQIKKAVKGIENIEVISYHGLTVDVCKQYDAKYLLRGVRSFTDFEYEQNMADINRKIAGIETVILFTLPEHASISSSVVRELDKYGYDTTDFLP
ncbi:MAG: pantetheine-phosphate adenylyltransferase [Bacteroidales bacterium]|nr:pantetheine-phosphate adenylyltransferase [Bacteroidales bacterium]